VVFAAAAIAVASLAGLRCGCGERLVGFPVDCTVDTDCATGQVCFDAVCRKKCPCPVGDSCVDTVCFVKDCEKLTCSAGLVCLGSTCGDPHCRGQNCAPLLCDPARHDCVECLVDTDCGANQKCDSGAGTCFSCPPAG